MLQLLVCEQSTAPLGYFHWLACVFSMADLMYNTDAGFLTLSTGESKYVADDMRHDKDALKPMSDGVQEASLVTACKQRFDQSRFETGTEREVVFAAQVCAAGVLSHGYSLNPHLQWEEMPKAYATNTTTRSTNVHTTAGNA